MLLMIAFLTLSVINGADVLESKFLLAGEPILDGPYDAIDAGSEISEHVSSSSFGDVPFKMLSEDLQRAIVSLGDNDHLMRVMDDAVISTQIFDQVLKYMTTRWTETQCTWVLRMDNIGDYPLKGWRYLVAHHEDDHDRSDFDDAADIFENLLYVLGDDNMDCIWCPDHDEVPLDLKQHLINLWNGRGTERNQRLAMIKYTAWKTSGVIWSDEFVAEMGFENDQELMESMVHILEDMELAPFTASDDSNWMDDGDDRKKCDLLDPVSLLNVHYAATIRELAEVFTEWKELGVSSDVTVAISFGPNIGGNIGFAVNGHGDSIMFDTVRSPLLMSNDIRSPFASKQGVDLVVTLGIYEDLEAINGFAITNTVDDSFPILPNTVFATLRENEDRQWSVNGLIMESAFDLNEGEYRLEYQMPLHSRWSTPIASLYSTECALEAAGVDLLNEWKGESPIMQSLITGSHDDGRCIDSGRLDSIRILESEVNGLPQRRKVKNTEPHTHGLMTLLFVIIFGIGLVFVGSKIDWKLWINGTRSEQITLLDGEQKRPLIEKSDNEPEIVIW